MAKLVQVITEMASTLGMTPGAVEQYVKPLRKAGLITSGPRGPGAPEVEPRDVARILLAILAGSPTAAVDHVGWCAELFEKGGDDRIPLLFGAGGQPKSLLDVVEALLVIHAAGLAPAVFAQDPVGMIGDDWRAALILEVRQTNLAALLSVTVETAGADPKSHRFWFSGFRRPVSAGDLETTKKVSGRLFASMGALLARPVKKSKGKAP